MAMVQKITGLIIGACAAGIVLIGIFVSEAGEADNIFRIGGQWGILIRILIGVIVVGVTAKIALHYFYPPEPTPPTAWPKAPLATSANHTPSSTYTDLVVRFETETNSWIVSADQDNVAAFQQIEVGGLLGDEIAIGGNLYSIPGPTRRRGAVLGLNGKLILTGFGSAWYSGYKIHQGQEIFRLRRNFLELFQRRYRLSQSREVICTFKEKNKTLWQIEAPREINIVLTVFAFWLVRQDVRHTSSN